MSRSSETGSNSPFSTCPKSRIFVMFFAVVSSKESFFVLGFDGIFISAEEISSSNGFRAKN